MPLNRRNTRTFHRTLFAGQLEKIRLLKRENDQRQGVVRAVILYQCRLGAVNKTSESLDGDMAAGYSGVWHIPRTELDRVGIHYLNSLDRIERLVGKGKGEVWQPEATTQIDVKLFENHVDLVCLMLKPRSL